METTGVKHYKHGIHQISGCIDIDGVVKEKFNYFVRPHPKALIDPEALAIGGVTEAQVMTYPTMDTVYFLIITMLSKYVNKYDKKDKMFTCGYNNAGFDDMFLRAFFKQNGDEYFGSWFWADVLDCRVLAAKYLMKLRHKMDNFKLSTVCKYVGIPVDESKLHDADYDIFLTRELYYALEM